MKPKAMTIIICALVTLMNTPTPAFADSDYDRDAVSVVVDLTVARPLTFALTVLGSAAFVISLPVAIPSRSVKNAAKILIGTPAKDTFTRPVGDLGNFL